MGLSNELASQFIKLTRDTKTDKKEATVHGTTVEYNGSIYVKLDGSDRLTPISTTTVVKPGERVNVLIKNHTATVTGNVTAPSARDEDVENVSTTVTELDNVLAYKVTATDIEAVNATIEQLKVKVAKFNELSAVLAKIETLQAKYAEMEYISATEAKILDAEIENLEADIATFDELSTEDLEAINADIGQLKAYNADFVYVSAEKLSAVKADITKLNATIIDAETGNFKFANIDFANITEAAVEKIFSDSGIIKDLVVDGGYITGELVGVTIKGDLIEAGTLKADRLVVLGTDGNYYKLNLDGMGTTTEVVEEDRIHGKTIVAKSITADRISVTDLVAFGATIGGFQIKDHSLYSGVKNSALNTTRGVYLGDAGEFAVGDATNFLRYFYDSETDTYKLEISAATIKMGGSSKTVQEELDEIRDEAVTATSKVDNLVIGGRNFLKNSGAEKIVDRNLDYNLWDTPENGETVTFSVWMKAEKDTTVRVYLNDDSAQGGVSASFTYNGVDTYSNPISITTEYAKYEVSGRFWKRDSFSYDRLNQYRMRVYGTESVMITGKLAKLEIGTKSTAYTPAPEDAVTALEEFASITTENIENLQSQIDGSITTWFYDYEPTVSNIPASEWNTDALKNQHLGDLFYIIDSDEKSGQVYRWALVSGSYTWVLVEDADVTKALADAARAQDTADKKRRVFVSTPTPPYDSGDIWTQGSGGDIMVCKTARTSGAYNSSDWQKASKYTDDTTVNNLSIGGTNLLLNSKKAVSNADYGFANYHPSSPLVPGEKYTLSICITPASTVHHITPYVSGGYQNLSGGLNTTGTNEQTLVKTFTMPNYYTDRTPDDDINYASITFYQFADASNTAGSGQITVHWVKLEKGDKATDWSPAPEDEEIGGRNLIPFSSLESAHLGSPITSTEEISFANMDVYGSTHLHIHKTYPAGKYTLNASYINGTEIGNLRLTCSVKLPGFTYNQYYEQQGRAYYMNISVPYTFDLPTDASIGLVLLTKDANTITGVLRNLKLERGSIATDWTPAPEDVQNGINNAQDAANAAAEVANSAYIDINTIKGQIITLVRDADGSTSITQTGSGWSFDISTLEKNLSDMSGQLVATDGEIDSLDSTVQNLNGLLKDVSDRTAYIDMKKTADEEPYIELGKRDDEDGFKVRITNKEIDFMEGASVVAYINNLTLFITKAIVKQELQIGDTTEAPYSGFVWKVRSNGNMGVVWRGPNSTE